MKSKFELFLETKGLNTISFAGQEAEEMAKLYNEYNEEARKALEDAVAKSASKEDIESLKSELATAQKEQMVQLNKTLKEYGLAIEKLNKDNQANSLTAQASDIRKALEENKANLTKLKDLDKSAAHGA